MKQTYIKNNPDGTPYFNYDFTDGSLNPETHAVVITGPISGPLTMADGTTYDVTPFAIPVLHEHHAEIHQKIKAAHDEAGTFDPKKGLTEEQAAELDAQ